MNKVTNIKIFLTEHTVGVIDNKFRSIKQYFNNEIYAFQKKKTYSQMLDHHVRYHQLRLELFCCLFSPPF